MSCRSNGPNHGAQTERYRGEELPPPPSRSTALMARQDNLQTGPGIVDIDCRFHVYGEPTRPLYASIVQLNLVCKRLGGAHQKNAPED